jgi:hypothetical protein
MAGYFSTGQSPQRAVVLMEEEQVYPFFLTDAVNTLLIFSDYDFICKLV